MVALLVGRLPASALGTESLAAPHLVDSEAASALRRLERSQQITPAEAARALDRLDQLVVARFAANWLLPRIWELRHNLTTYDATYVALAETLEATSLLTTDARLARARGVRCAIELI